MISTSLRDSRHALRMLMQSPGFTAVAILTFALGIGANSAVFSVFNGVLLRPLPCPDSDRITMVWMDNRRQGIKEDITSYPTFRDWRDQNASYAYMAGVTEAAFTLTGANEPERLDGARVARRRSIRNDDAGAIEGSLHGVAPADPVTQAWRSCS